MALSREEFIKDTDDYIWSTVWQIFIANYCNYFLEPPRGTFSEKCDKLDLRCITLLGRESVLVVNRLDELAREFIEYCQSVYGLDMPLVVSPRLTDLDQRTLIRDVRADAQLVDTLSHLSTSTIVNALIAHPEVTKLADELSMHVGGMGHKLMQKGVGQWANSKRIFQSICAQHGISVPPDGKWFTYDPFNNTRHVIRAISWAERLIKEHGCAYLRLDQAAGGLGTKPIRSLVELEALKTHIMSSPGWKQDVLCERGLPGLEDEASVTFYIDNNGRIALKCVADRRVENGESSEGQWSPSRIWILRQREMILAGRKLARELVNAGIRSQWFDIDFGWTKDGQLIAFEWNVRYLATLAGWHLCRRFKGGNGVFINHDTVKCGKRVTLKMIRDMFEYMGIAWSKERGDGVIITLPARDGSFGCVILADNHDRAKVINGKILAWTKATL